MPEQQKIIEIEVLRYNPETDNFRNTQVFLLDLSVVLYVFMVLLLFMFYLVYII